MMPQFLNMLSWWQWLVLASVPPAIVALYFLKLKRRPVEVPSTYLWHKAIEDLHVNTIWQRLRRNLLLLLQLLLILLAMLAVLRPAWRGTDLSGNRFIFLIDNSASMQATDVEKSRLEEAKRKAKQMVEQMEPGDVAMVVSFADAARVERMFTSNRRELLRGIEDIKPTSRRTSMAEALKVASGLANPGRAAYESSDIQVAEAMPATLYILSDGNFGPVTGFSTGNLNPIYLPIGEPDCSNVGIVALSAGHHETKADQWQAFARLRNFSDEEIQVTVELSRDDQPIDADQLTLGADETKGVTFDLGIVESGILKLEADSGDDFGLDDVAWTVVSPPHPAQVLLISSGNEPLELALATGEAAELAEVTLDTPDFLKKPEYKQQADAGMHDLVIFDQCRPEAMPQSNTFFIGELPSGDAWKADPRQEAPQIIDVDPDHPLLQWLDLGDVLLADGTPLVPPPSASVLIDSHIGPMLAIAPREGFEDAVLGFVLIEETVGADGQRERYVGTNWPIRASFPGFVLNVLRYLGSGQIGQKSEVVRPGDPVVLESPRPDKPLVVRLPGGRSSRLAPTPGSPFTLTDTSKLGVYEVELEKKPLRQVAVNLFDPAESNLRPATEITLGSVPMKGQPAGWESVRREIWKGLLLFGLVVLCIEWYVFNRRVSM